MTLISMSGQRPRVTAWWGYFRDCLHVRRWWSQSRDVHRV